MNQRNRHSHWETLRDSDDNNSYSQRDAFTDFFQANFVSYLVTYNSLQHDDYNCNKQNDQGCTNSDKSKCSRQVEQFILQGSVAGVELCTVSNFCTVIANTAHKSCTRPRFDEVVSVKEWVIILIFLIRALRTCSMYCLNLHL